MDIRHHFSYPCVVRKDPGNNEEAICTIAVNIGDGKEIMATTPRSNIEFYSLSDFHKSIPAHLVGPPING